jgi:hypothetical protein
LPEFTCELGVPVGNDRARESMETVDIIVVKTSDLFSGNRLRGRYEVIYFGKSIDNDEYCIELLPGIVDGGRKAGEEVHGDD